MVAGPRRRYRTDGLSETTLYRNRVQQAGTLRHASALGVFMMHGNSILSTKIDIASRTPEHLKIECGDAVPIKNKANKSRAVLHVPPGTTPRHE